MTIPFDPRLLQLITSGEPVQPRFPGAPPSLADRIGPLIQLIRQSDESRQLEPPPGETQPSLFDRFSDRLSGLPPGGLLSVDDRTFGRQQGLLGAGGSLLQSSGPSRDPISIGQAIGQAIPAGQQAAQVALAELQFLQDREQNQQVAAQRQQIMQKYLGSGELGIPQFQAMLRDLTALGDVEAVEAARPIAAVLQSMISRQATGRPPTPRLQAGVGPEGDPGIFRIPEEGAAVRVPGIEPIPPRPTATPKPKNFLADPRVGQLQTRFIQLKDEMSEPVEVGFNTPNREERLDSGELIMTRDGRVLKQPPDAATVRREAMKQARREMDFRFTADERKKLDTIIRESGILGPRPSVLDEAIDGSRRIPRGGGARGEDALTAGEITQARKSVQGLERQDQEDGLRASGYSTADIRRILDGR